MCLTMAPQQKKNPSVGLLIVLLLSFLLSACDVEAQVKNNSEDSTFEVIKISEVHSDYTLDITYPLTSHPDIDEALSAFIGQRIIRFKDELLETTPEQTRAADNLYTIIARVAYSDQNVIAVRISESARVGQNEALEIIHTFNYNRHTGKDIPLDQLFDGQSDYLERLSDISYHHLRSDKRLSSINPLDLQSGLMPFTQNFTSFLYEVDHLVLLFNSGQIAPVGMGPISLSLSAKDLQPLTMNATAFESTYISSYPIFPLLNTNAPEDEASYFAPPEPERPPIEAIEKPIAITFDDGPHPKYTEQILQILENHDARATFFMIGKHIRKYPDLAKMVFDKGHSIGNHSWSHPQLTKLETPAIMDQVDMTQRTLENITGVAPKFMRAPYGRYNKKVLDAVNLPLIQWSVDPEDWKTKEAKQIASHVIEHAKPGSIVLLHDLRYATVEALPIILDELSKMGFTFVSVDELLTLEKGKVYYQLEPTKP